MAFDEGIRKDIHNTTYTHTAVQQIATLSEHVCHPPFRSLSREVKSQSITLPACRNRQLGLILLKEARQGPKSKFHIWIESLPQEVPTLLHWTDKELQQLQMDSTATEKEFVAQVCPYLSLVLNYLGECYMPPWRHVSLQLHVPSTPKEETSSKPANKSHAWQIQPCSSKMADKHFNHNCRVASVAMPDGTISCCEWLVCRAHLLFSMLSVLGCNKQILHHFNHSERVHLGSA